MYIINQDIQNNRKTLLGIISICYWCRCR